jgi:hypothetical protein
MAENPLAARGTDRFLLGIVVGAVLLILLGVVVVLVVGRAPAASQADPASPAGVVQAYVEALRTGDVDLAYGYLSRSAQGAVSLDEYRRRFHRPFVPSTSGQRVLIEPATIAGDRAEVQVTLSRFSARADPFSANTYHQDTTINLVKEDGAWRISQPIGPYPFVY